MQESTKSCGKMETIWPITDWKISPSTFRLQR